MQPTKTRWNSIANMTTSILQMKDAFDTIRLSNDPETKTLRDVIPDEMHFNILQCLDPLLQLIKQFCTKVEEDTPKIHKFLVSIHNLKSEVKKLSKMATDDEGIFEKLDSEQKAEIIHVMTNFVDAFFRRLKRFDSEENYTTSAVLNPHYKGVPLFNLNKYRDTIHKMINRHQSTHQQRSFPHRNNENEETSMSEGEFEEMSACDRENLERIRQIKQRRANGEQSDSNKPPLALEISRYEDMESAGINEDALEWWKKKKNELPLLSEMARNYFAIQVTSSASERVFSTGGRIVNKLRSGLSYETTTKLVYIEQNYKYVPDSLATWNLNKVNKLKFYRTNIVNIEHTYYIVLHST